VTPLGSAPGNSSETLDEHDRRSRLAVGTVSGMRHRRHLVLLAAGAVALSACSAAVDSAGNPTATGELTETTETADAAASTTTTTIPPTTTTEPPLDVYEPTCVVQVAAGESLSLIADRFDDDTVRVDTISAENDLEGNLIVPGQLLDVCVDNGVDDRTGENRPPNQALVADATRANVESQQTKLNELFAAYGTPELIVDGISGSVTRQRLCAARLALGLPASTLDMEMGSPEEQMLMAATSLTVPPGTPIANPRWVFIEETCQMMFIGSGWDIAYIFPTSTGEPGHETRPQDATRAYRFDPALDNDGWHNSTDFPVEEDNPLNGNMYKPIYFDGGLAIHGANNVPTSPQSKGCARLRLEHQDALIAFLELSEVERAFNNSRTIDLAVTITGRYVPPA